MQLFFVVFWEKSTRLTCRWKEKHMTTVLVHCNRLRLAVSLETLVTSLVKGRKVPGSPPPWASKGSPRHLQCRIWWQRFTLQWKAEISNHTFDRPRVPRVISLPAVDYLVGFFKTEILFSYSVDSSIHVFKCDAEAFKHNFSACRGMCSYP